MNDPADARVAAPQRVSVDASRPSQRLQWHWFRPLRLQILAIAAVSVIAAQAEAIALVLIAPVALSVASGERSVDVALGPLALQAEVATLLSLAVVAILVAAGCTVVGAFLRARMVARWERAERDGFIDEFVGTDLPTQITTRSGDLQVSFAAYVGKGGLALGALSTMLKAAAAILIYLAVSAAVDWRGTLLLGLLGAVFVGVLRPVNRLLRRTSAEMSTIGLSYADAISETTRAIRDLRVFNALDVFRDRLRDLSGRGAKLQQRASFLGALTTPLYQYLGLLVALAILWLATASDGLDVAVVAAITLLLLRSLGYGQQLQNAYQMFVESVPYFERVVEIRELYQRNNEPDGSAVLPEVRELEFEGVEYTYPDGTVALRGVDLRIRSGEILGIAGPSGSGKSTLAQIVLRMRPPTRGHYAINGEPAESFTRASFYRQVTLVPQRCEIVSDSLTENIRMFDPEIGDEAIGAAAVAAGLQTVIDELPDGFATQVGPTTRELSGGQEQRLSIARALVRDPTVIVLDEPTSALDAHAERIVQDTVTTLAEHAAVVVIAHRLSTLTACDRILVLRDGVLEAIGTFEEVCAQSAYFAHAVEVGKLTDA